MEVSKLFGTLINGLYATANTAIDGICLVLPTFSVSGWLSNAFQPFANFLGAINYFIPFGIMIDIASAWVAAILVWYGFTGVADGVYQSCISWLNSAYPGELKKCTAYSNSYVTRVKDDDGNVYNVCAFSDGDVEFKIDSNGYFCWGTTTDAKLIYTSGVKSNYLTAWRKGLVEDMTFSKVFPCASSTVTTRQGTGSLVYGDGLRSNGSIASSLDDEIYAGWTGKAITVSDSRTIYLPISVSETVAGTGSLTQDVAQAGTTYYPGAVEETDEELPVVDVPVVGADLLGIVTLLKSILQALLNIYRVVSSNISSWWDNATTTIALNIASLAASIETWWTTATETIIGGITDAVTSITEAISTAIADVVTWLKSVAATLTDVLEWAKGLPAVISQAISTAIADVIEWLKSLGATLADVLEWIKSLPSAIVDGISSALTAIFVPSEDFVTVKLEAIKAKFPFVSSVIDTGKAIGSAFTGFYTEPPIIYAELHNATGSYYYGDRAIILDLRWYAEYKPTVDILISAFLWAVFCWRTFIKIPGIISGMPGDFVMDTVSQAGMIDRLPTRKAGYEIQRQANREYIRNIRKGGKE